ncbi:hypothetical protein [Cognataquiflexum aquatile]|uniref:hypothetical protein n=1 Tax=Cognataquiflexum aquatile TaxID=2249427 RepID=UPI000DE92EF2|nr:hypothetical protein [Cognataquiflexum aquatile]
MGKGSKQTERKPKALEESYFSVDERSLMDLLNFTLHFAEKVNYFDFSNNLQTYSWKPFFENDPLFIMAKIAGTDLRPYKKTHDILINNYSEVNNQLKDKDGKSPANILELTNQLKEKEIILSANIFELTGHLNDWKSKLMESNYSGPFSNEIENSWDTIESDVINKIKNLKNLYNPSDSDNNFLKNSIEILLSEGFKTVYKSMTFLKKLAYEKFENEFWESKYHKPQIGLLLAFFKLFEEVKRDLNFFTQKHLDFYYQKVLEQNPSENTPNSAIIGVKPSSSNPDQIIIEAGQKVNLIYGDKVELEFETIYNENISHSKISEIEVLFKSSYPPFKKSRLDGTYLNIVYSGKPFVGTPSSKVSFGKKLNGEFQTILGEDQHLLGSKERTLSETNLGIGISSPALMVEKGNLKITTSIRFSEKSIGTFQYEVEKLRLQKENITTNSDFSWMLKTMKHKAFAKEVLSNSFLISYSSISGWTDLPDFFISEDFDYRTIEIIFEINKNQPMPSIYNKEIHGSTFETEWPIIKVLLNNDTNLPPYGFMKGLMMEEVFVKVEVTGVEKMDISNQLGELDIENPFQPFGPIPELGSKLKISNPYFLSKYLSKLVLNFQWSGLPLIRNGFTEYYNSYPYDYNNESFCVELSVQRGKTPIKHRKSYQEFHLFETEIRDDWKFLLPNNSAEVDLNSFEVEKGPGLTAEERSRNDLAIVLSLNSPEKAFGHQVYSELFGSISMQNSRLRKKKLELPNQPYTPVLEHLLVDYTNFAKENLSRSKDKGDVSIKLFQIFPFGHVQVYPASLETSPYFLPQISHKGNLIIGLIDVKPNEIITLGFELEPAVFPITAYKSPDLLWEFLDNNKWHAFGDLMLEDSTNDLIKSGIVKIKLPNSINLENTIHSKGKFWIRISYDGQTDLNSKIKQIFVNAVRLDENTSNKKPNPPIGIPIKKVEFLGGNTNNEIFGVFDLKVNQRPISKTLDYSKISETLRHKNRASSTSDFEKIILAQFPQIQEVFVYGRSDFPGKLLKGNNIQIVVIPISDPALGTAGKVVSFEILQKIKDYLITKTSPLARFEISNAIYERLKVRCNVKFQKSYTDQSGYYRDVLNRELVMFLSSSTSYNRKGLNNMYVISLLEILNFIEARPYVDFVTQFSVLQIVKVKDYYNIIDTARDGKKIDLLRTITPYAALTSAESHSINIINEEKIKEPKPAGIGDLSIDSDLVILEIK